MTNAIVQGSIQAIANNSGKSIAESFINCDVIVIVDTSGSMAASDSRGGQSRFTVACDELRQLQANLPGKIAVVSFSSTVQFCPGGVPIYEGGGTDMKRALGFVMVADVPDMRFILISDGQPNDPDGTLAVAKQFRNRIDTIYVGPEDRPEGRDFLQRLAAASGGQIVTADRARELGAGITFLLRG